MPSKASVAELWIAAYKVVGVDAAIEMATRPKLFRGSAVAPAPAMGCHVCPASVDRYTPFAEFPAMAPRAAYAMFPSVGSNTTEVPVPVSTRVQLAAPSVDRQIPPVLVHKSIWLLAGWLLMAPILSRRNGPIRLVQVAPPSVDFKKPAP